jgi:hypothetical protein
MATNGRATQKLTHRRAATDSDANHSLQNIRFPAQILQITSAVDGENGKGYLQFHEKAPCRRPDGAAIWVERGGKTMILSKPVERNQCCAVLG